MTKRNVVTFCRRCKGRLKVCTSSLFFDPDDNSLPIVRLPFAKTDEVTRDTRLISDSGRPQVVVGVTEFFEMKAYNEVGPYIHKKCDGSAKAPFQHWFAFEHTPVDEFLRFVHHLVDMHKHPGKSLESEIDKRHSDKFDIRFKAFIANARARRQAAKPGVVMVEL